MPPDHASAGITTAQLFEPAYTAVAAAPASTPTTPPMRGEQDRLGEELGPDLGLRRAEGATEADLRAAFQHRDDHDVGDADGTHDQRHDPEPEEEAVERPRRGGPGGEHVGRLADVDLVGCLGVGGRREQRLHRGDVVGVRAHVDGARRAGLLLALDEADVAEVPLGGRIADQRAVVDVGLQRRGLQDACDVEPLASQPDPLVGEDPVDAQPLRGGRTEYGDRLAGGPRVEPGAAGEAGVEHGEQVQAGGPHLQPAGVGHGDQPAPVHVLALHQRGVGQQLDVVEVRDPRRGFEGQLRRLPGDALAGLEGQHVRAEPVDLGEQPGLRGGGQSEDGDDRCCPDRDPERGQRGAQRPGAQPDARHPQPVLGRSRPPSALMTSVPPSPRARVPQGRCGRRRCRRPPGHPAPGSGAAADRPGPRRG